MEKKERVNITLDKTVLERVDKKAKSYNLNRSEYINIVLNNYMTGKSPDQVEEAIRTVYGSKKGEE